MHHQQHVLLLIPLDLAPVPVPTLAPLLAHMQRCGNIRIDPSSASPREPNWVHNVLASYSTSTKHSSAHRATTPLRRLSLHLLRHLDVDLKELRHASVQAHALAFVEVGFAIVAWDAFLRAGVYQPYRASAKEENMDGSGMEGRRADRDLLIEHVRHHFDFRLRRCDLLRA